ncbi:MarR family winged helix-turn-helix transcriptional regulator [Actinomycetospora termitidis]|uniref:MarR family transcriptional regulator n=1 Tax=Actinomycetospora termitidis TaxID=3053470 RepID=A0ABT7MFU6_9PSEU|nr:MarR family transcriptional regulator [Actinomycetospora sp. Odt1-22]MDL5159550.1 MarR family transcriptional regulator [Actinomycetospora sp. Odt1-22]
MTDEAIRREPGLEALTDTTLAVRRLISASQDLTIRTARHMRLNVGDMTAILLLSEHGPMGVVELARRLGVSSPATTLLVDRLESSGHVERVRDPDDGRRVRVTDTPAGRASTRQAWLPAIQEIDAVCRSLPESDQVVARDLLDRLTAVMTRGARS